jgi:hypothetical protein
LLEGPQTTDCTIGPDLLDAVLKGTMRWSSNPSAENDRSAWSYTKLDTIVYQKVKLLLEYREVDVTLKNIIQAQSLKGVGRKIIQLFLDTSEKAKMTEEVKKYAASLVVVKELTFTIKPKAPSASVFAEREDTQEEHTHLPAPQFPSTQMMGWDRSIRTPVARMETFLKARRTLRSAAGTMITLSRTRFRLSR